MHQFYPIFYLFLFNAFVSIMYNNKEKVLIQFEAFTIMIHISTSISSLTELMLMSILYICHCILFELLNISNMEICCTLGFLLFGIVSSSNSKVTIDRAKSSWHQAKHQCTRYGGDILTVKSKEKLRRVMEVLQDAGANETFWIGASERRRQWFWSHSK